jgi:hypothetical protein
MKTITLACFLFLTAFFANTVTAQFVAGAGNTTVLLNNGDLVGIGTLAPTPYKINVVRTDNNSSFAMFRNATANATTGTVLIDLQNSAAIRWRYGVGGVGNGLGLTAGQFYIERAGIGAVLTIPTNGNVGIGVNAPAQKLQVNGNIGTIGDQSGLFFSNGEFFKDAPGVGIANLEIRAHANFAPDGNCAHNLGTPTLQWNNLYLCGTVMKVQKGVSNIQDLTYGLKDILKLRAVTYTDDQKKIGLIAQEAQKVIPEMVSTSTIITDEATGKVTTMQNEQLGLDYDVLVPVLVNAIKEQQAAIEAKDKQLNDLQAQVEEFQTQLNELKSMLVTQGLQPGNKIGNENSSKAILQSVAPNPFNTKTTIRYFIPNNGGSVAINIVAANGGVMKTYSGLQKGSGQLVINGSELAAGTYMAVLVVNGVKVGSKQMVLTK